MKKRLGKLFSGVSQTITNDDVAIVSIVIAFFIIQFICAYFLRHAPLDF
jgi:hypothetical protein